MERLTHSSNDSSLLLIVCIIAPPGRRETVSNTAREGGPSVIEGDGYKDITKKM